MNIRNAILRAADHIERNPKKYQFMQTHTPRDSGCRTPACALGWISHFAEAYSNNHRGCLPLMGLDEDGEGAHAFYDRMSAIDSNWRVRSANVVSALRLYADKYHPAPKQDLIPASIRRIFETEAV